MSNYEIDKLFEITCCGNLDEIKELVIKCNFDIKKFDCQLFNSACVDNGKIEVVKWLYEYGKIDTNEIGQFGSIFLDVCINRHIEVAEWLYNVTKFEKRSFNYTCVLILYCGVKQKFHKIIKWLFELDLVDMDIIDDCTNNGHFIYLCKNNQLELAKFIYSKYEKSEKHNEIKQIVKEEKENYVNGFIVPLHNNDIINDVLLDMNVFTIELPKYLFY